MTAEHTSERSLEPSTFLLDVYFAQGCAGDAVLAAHVSQCARCTAYLAELQRISLEPEPTLPLTGPAPRALPPYSSKRSFMLQLTAAASVLALGSFVLWALRPDGAYIASKGVPAAQVLIRTGDRARVWDGKAPVQAGDVIALRAGCDHFERVAVAVASGQPGKSSWTRVFDDECRSAHDAPLPFSLQVDDTPGTERIALVFSRTRLDDEALRATIERGDRAAEVWVIPLLLPKIEGGHIP